MSTYQLMKVSCLGRLREMDAKGTSNQVDNEGNTANERLIIILVCNINFAII